jgi:transposase
MGEKTVKRSYAQDWTAYNAAQTNEKAKLQLLLYELCCNIEEPERPSSRRGPKPLLLADMLFSVVMKVYCGFSSRRTISDLKEAQAKGYIAKAGHFNSLCNYLESESLTTYLKHLITTSSLPLKAVETDFAVDSSGFSTGRFVRWFDVKYGGMGDKRDWVKLHLMCGVKTNIVTSVEVSNRKDHDSPYLRPLLDGTIKGGFKMREVSADKGYDSLNNRRLVLTRGAVPYIPFRTLWKEGGDKGELWRRMYHLYKYHEAEFNEHYHKRSNVEATFSMIKAKFGERIRSRGVTAQVNEVLCKVLCHNLCCVIQSMYELGVEPDYCAENNLAQ